MIEFAEDAEDCTGATLRAMGFKTEKIRETAKGRTPDFAACRGSEHVLVEVKTTSPRSNLQSFGQGIFGFFYSRFGGWDSTDQKLFRALRGAIQQFASYDPRWVKPRVVVIVNFDRMQDSNSMRILLKGNQPAEEAHVEIRRIMKDLDGFVWIDHRESKKPLKVFYTHSKHAKFAETFMEEFAATWSKSGFFTTGLATSSEP